MIKQGILDKNLEFLHLNTKKLNSNNLEFLLEILKC